MNLSKVDLNLFIVFDAIYTEANLTRAGQIVALPSLQCPTPFAAARNLQRPAVRAHRTRHGAHADGAEHHRPVRNALALLRTSVQESRIFNPQQANKTFRISMTDLTEAVILPPLFQRLRRLRPQC